MGCLLYIHTTICLSIHPLMGIWVIFIFESERKWKSLSHVWLFATSWTVHGILQARILEWVAFSFSGGSSQPRYWTQVSHIAGGLFISWATREAQEYWSGWVAYPFSSESSWPRNQTRVSCIAGRFFTNWAIRDRYLRNKEKCTRQGI